MDEYKEALNRAKELHESGNALTKAQMEIVFPELNESEDEKIRTRLIALVEAFGQGSYKNEMLAYLERQKEPLAPEEKMNHPLYLEGFDVGKKVGEVLKEQKPAEWSEEEKGILIECISVLQNSSHWLLADKLSSLRPQPHWKPSKDEITAIEVAVKYLLAHTSDEQLRKNVTSVLEHLEQL